MSPDTGLTIDIVETIDYQDFFEVAIMIMIINLFLQLTIIDLHGDHDGTKGASWRALIPPRTKLGVRWQARSFSSLPKNPHMT